MRVTIETDNGHMEVDLDEFFPTSLVRVRKLFRLLQSGTDGITLRNIRSYLAGMEQRNAKAGLELQISTGERELEMIKQRRNQLERDIRAAKERVRREEQIERSAKVWVREFDYIFGGDEDGTK